MWATPGVSLSCWMFVCWRVCVLSVESRPYWRGLQRFFRTLSEQREGAERQRTTPLEHRADRGSDSTFQMADIARRILARGSTSPPVCETADCFLFLSLSVPILQSSSSLTPCLCLFTQIPNRKTQLSTQVGCLANPQFLPLFFNLFIFWQAYLLSFTIPSPYVTLPKLPFLSCSVLPFQQKSSLHMVMIILHFLIFALLEHRPLFSPPTSLLLH